MSQFDFDTFQPIDKKFQEILNICQQTSELQANILIMGETGVGKSSLAAHIHKLSKRKKFYRIDCKNQSYDLASVEQNSTLIIEDIDCAGQLFQATLFDFLLQSATHKVRVIATSKKDLRLMVKQDLFRAELFYKLAVIQFDIPKLNELTFDFKKISEFILQVCQIIHNKANLQLSDSAWSKLMSWKWPGNIRELENVLERAVILSRSQIISAEQILFESTMSNQRDEFSPGMSLFEVEKKLILQTLELTSQNRTKAANLLGISIRTLRNKLNEYRGEISL